MGKKSAKIPLKEVPNISMDFFSLLNRGDYKVHASRQNSPDSVPGEAPVFNLEVLLSGLCGYGTSLLLLLLLLSFFVPLT